MWRSDWNCGTDYPLPDGRATECNPEGKYPCCGGKIKGYCGNTADDCQCSDCVDFREVQEIRRSGDSCAVVNIGGFLKHTCYNATSGQLYFKCAYSEKSYQRFNNYTAKLDSVSSECENDGHGYQVCGFNTQMTNNNVFCGGYICPAEEAGKHKYIECGEDCSVDNRDCSFDITDTTQCDDKCDTDYCEDESYCNGYRYGVACTWERKEYQIPIYLVCDGYTFCDNGEDEENCDVSDSTPYKCTHHRNHKVWHKKRTVPIFDHTRCSVFDMTRGSHYDNFHRYCENYLDQTNCSDIGRVGGWCLVDGYMTSISKYVV